MFQNKANTRKNPPAGSDAPEHPHIPVLFTHRRFQACLLSQTFKYQKSRLLQWINKTEHRHTAGRGATVETQEPLLCAPVSSSRFCRFFALISFMASSMERVSLLLATGTEDREFPTAWMKRLNWDTGGPEFLRDVWTHHSHKPCWPPACEQHL